MSPNTLFYISTMYRIIRNLPEGAYLKLKIIFISLDPERDTPQSMKEYLKNFSKNIIGVTGSSANDIELKECLKKFKIQTKKVSGIKGMESSNYLIEHSRRVFLMDP
jgi:protein SCO1/2